MREGGGPRVVPDVWQIRWGNGGQGGGAGVGMGSRGDIYKGRGRARLVERWRDGGGMESLMSERRESWAGIHGNVCRMDHVTRREQ